MHMAFAFDVVDTARHEEPDLFDEQMIGQVRQMPAEAVECEVAFAEDLLGQGVAGLSLADMRAYLGQPPTGGWPSSASSRCTAQPTR